MKILLSIALLILCCVNSINAQVEIFTKANFIPAESSKTIFLYRESDEDNLEEMKQVLESNWNYNKLELMSFSDFSEDKLENNGLVFSISYDYIKSYSPYYYKTSYGIKTVNGAASNYVDFYLTLLQKSADSIFTELAVANLSISGPTIVDVCRTKKTSKEIVLNQYTTHDIFSWNYAYLGTVLNSVSSKLKNGIGTENSEVPLMDWTKLKSEKLYIADAVEIEQNTMSGKEKKVDLKADIDKFYNYDFELISTEKINDLISDGSEGYLLMFQKIGRGKKNIIIDLSNKTIVYSYFKHGEYNFEAKDMRLLNKEIEKE